MTEINESLREHVTSVGFNLSLGKTHIAALVKTDIELKANLSTTEYLQRYGAGPREPRVFNLFATGNSGLIQRGLLEHIAESRRKPGERYGDMKPRRIWRITPAGRLVINLLKEAGIYQEYAAMLPAPVGLRSVS